MSISFLVYFGVGRLLIFLTQKFVADATKIELLNKWASCDLCSGVWIYSLLAIITKVDIFSGVFPYVPIVSGVITGCVCSFVMHLLVIGWKAKFDVVVI